MNQAAPKRILLIDDDEDDYFLVKDYLEEVAGKTYHVDWEPHAEAALKHMCSRAYQVYLIDFRLGTTSGLELLQRARQEGCSDPMIMLTGKGDAAIDESSMRAGASDYLVKTEINGYLLERAIRFALERYEIQRFISEQEQKYRGLFEQSIDAIYLTNELSYIRNANASMVNLLRYTQAELYYMQVRDLFASRDDFNSFQNELSSRGFVQGREVRLKSKDGKMLLCLVSSSALKTPEDKLLGYQAILHDISTLRQAENEIRIAEKLSLTGRMARMIAHEVRNPLTNINLSLEELRDLENENEEVVFYTDIIKRNSNRINELISKLLESSKINELVLEQLPGDTVVEEALTFCKDRAQLMQIELVIELKGHSTHLNVDREKVKIALVNILTNAIEAVEGKENPKIAVRTRVIPGHFEVAIEDNGIGMDEATLAGLFEPFFTSKKSGMGLGMTSTKSILNKHGAAVHVASQPNVGTTFTLEFPLTHQPDV